MGGIFFSTREFGKEMPDSAESMSVVCPRSRRAIGFHGNAQI
jgi:hypothetical protein